MLENGKNKAINELFRQVKKDTTIISDFKDLFDWKEKSKHQQSIKS